MKNRSFIITAVCISAAVFLFMTVEAFARAGGGRSSGSRGSRSMSTPTRPSTPSTPSSTAASPSTSTSATPAPGATPQAGGFMRGMMGGLAGGFLGSMLFGGLGGLGGVGDGGGVGMLEIILLGGLAYLGYRFFVKRRQEQAAWSPQGAGTTPGPYAAPAAVADTAGEDRNKGLEYIRRMDPAFDQKTFGETASDAFFRLQGGWTRRDLSPVSGLLTDEMRATLQADADALKARGQINRLENISVRNVEITEAWQESGHDYVTVIFLANLLDYTTDEGGKVLSGSDTVPVKFEEFWTFSRPVGPGAWRLSAIQQAG
jgi:predicted lipid-binding transport protein (Tim44 family)